MTRSMTTMTLLCAVLVSATGLSNGALAQRGPSWRGGGGWGPHGAYSKLYDPKTVETLTGEVIAIGVFTPMQDMRGGVHLKLKTATETVSVHLGPAWYIENQETKIEIKDKIEIKGSRVTIDGKPAILAAEIKKGDEVLRVRDDNGFPYWAGWRRR